MLLKQVIVPEVDKIGRSHWPIHPAVHFQQGDLDGACGVYCLLLALIRGGLLTKRKALALFERTSLLEGDFACAVRQRYFEGTTPAMLKEYSMHFPNVELLSIPARSLPRAIRKVKSHLDGGQSVLVWVTGVGLEHWTLVVGYHCIARSGREKIGSLLALDPSEPSAGLHPNNAWFELPNDTRPGRYITQTGRTWEASIHHIAVVQIRST